MVADGGGGGKRLIYCFAQSLHDSIPSLSNGIY